MAMRDDGIGFTVDPEDSAELVAWTAQRAAILRDLGAAQQRVAALDAYLASPDAVAARAEVSAAGDALSQARAAATTAQERFDSADAEAHRFEANEVAAAVAAVDAATLVVSQALAELLREASNSAALTATVDGLALRERYRAAIAVDPPHWDHTTIPFPTGPADIIDPELALPAVGDADQIRLLSILDRLDERVDAVADLVTAESVHQLVQGNPARSGGSLAVAAQGRVPDEFDVIRTPRPGYDVTHRLLALVDPGRPAPWTVPWPGPSARLDPVTATWVARLLPDPAHVAVLVRLVMPEVPGPPPEPGPIESGPPGGESGPPGQDDDGEPDPRVPVDMALSEVDLDPFGWIRVAANPAELELRLADAGQRRWRAVHGEPPPEGRIVVEPVSPVPGGVQLADLLAAARAAGAATTAARALDPQDLVHPAAADATPPSAAAVEVVAERVRAVEAWLDQLVESLESPPAEVPALLELLLQAASAGVAEAVPASTDPELLLAAAGAAVARLRPRRAASPFTADPANPTGSLVRARSRAEELAGFRLPMPAAFVSPLDATATADLAAGANRLSGSGRSSVRAWLLDHARVRPATRTFLATLDLAETLGAAERLEPRVTQLPTRTVDTWAGATPAPRAGAVSLVVQASFGNQVPATVAGLVLDTWSQPVPAEGHDTGVAFHYDQPDAAPPQTLLVAVHPDPSPDRPAHTWDLDTLLDVVTSTFALARDRATAAELCTVAGVEVPDA